MSASQLADFSTYKLVVCVRVVSSLCPVYFRFIGHTAASIHNLPFRLLTHTDRDPSVQLTSSLELSIAGPQKAGLVIYV